MQRVLISLPEDLFMRMQRVIPARQRSKLISDLLTDEIKKREHQLYEAALAVEADTALNTDMADWETTLNDGFKS